MTPMEISEAWWQLFTLTGSIEAYLLYRDSLNAGGFPPVSGELAAVGEQPGTSDK
ncbi:hypothetical protein MTHERMOG20_17160 [Moorella thermoacetica]|uniref:YqzL-like protein n=3 Tax=Neomoorella thermoacetica TaxID=1525 RepID=A0A1D7X8P5_NEOTH|nr:hypothetical protein MOTHE_c05500 [Moorella thermoacetica]GAF26330.1 hypothetical protein MTY_1669 [Moorella thermoacetica Y72]AKX95998.1 hypothetical protein MOTHA_c06390 [Moorella thermoacetica]AOQ23265.1 hypothetical protein Maut_00803 [Moorella thermoacetica]APC07721.1 hypothetical protein MTJW_05490 [Moorella thermoacetica]